VGDFLHYIFDNFRRARQAGLLGPDLQVGGAPSRVADYGDFDQQAWGILYIVIDQKYFVGGSWPLVLGT
jgi:hypothetical protein